MILRPGECASDDERLVAWWLLESDGDLVEVAESTGVPVEEIRAWMRTLADREGAVA